MRSCLSKVPGPKYPRFAIKTKPLAAKSTPHPRWQQWQLSGNMVWAVIPGIVITGFLFGLNGDDVLLPSTVSRHWASWVTTCQSEASQRWHFCLQLKPQLSAQNLASERGQKGSTVIKPSKPKTDSWCKHNCGLDSFRRKGQSPLVPTQTSRRGSSSPTWVYSSLIYYMGMGQNSRPHGGPKT